MSEFGNYGSGYGFIHTPGAVNSGWCRIRVKYGVERLGEWSEGALPIFSLGDVRKCWVEGAEQPGQY